MSPRLSSGRPLLAPAGLVAAGLVAAATVLAACGMPQPSEPPPPPEAEPSWRPELYGGPVQDDPGMEPPEGERLPGDAYRQGLDDPHDDSTAGLEGVPAAAYPPVIVTMPPVPNPEPAPQHRAAATPRAEAASAPAPEPRPAPRRTARVADDRLMGGPATPRPPARRTETRAATSHPAATTAAPAPAARAPIQGPAAERGAATPTRPTSIRTPGRPNPAAALPAADTPEGRAARLRRLEGSLRTLIERDSTLTAPATFTPGQEERITLTFPRSLSESLTREARELDLRDLAAEAETRVQLQGEGWTIEPEEPQTDELRAGRTSSFTWRATPERGAGPLTAEVQAVMGGGERFETLQLGQLTGEVTGPGPEVASTGGVPWRVIGLTVLLLAALLGALLYARRKDDHGGRKRHSRGRSEPVNLTRRNDPDPDPSRP